MTLAVILWYRDGHAVHWKIAQAWQACLENKRRATGRGFEYLIFRSGYSVISE